MVNFKKNNLSLLLQSLLIFAACLAMFFFMLPQSDVFLFARSLQDDIGSVFNEALYYGNGRLLGNIMGMFFSCYFRYAFILVSVTLTLIVVLANKLIFNSNKFTLFFMALIIVFMSGDMMNESYFLFASFVNFVFPCMLFLLSAVIVKFFHDKEHINAFLKGVLILISFVLTVTSCLFSENTAIIVAAFMFLVAFYSMYNTRKIKLIHISNAVASLIGVAVIMLLPKFLGTSDKMAHYRGYSVGIMDMVSSYARFSEVILNQVTVIALTVAALIYLCWKRTNLNNKFRIIISCALAFCPLIASVLREFSTKFYLARSNIIACAVMAMIFLLAFIIIIAINDKKLRMQCLGWGVWVMSSIAPMMLVTQYGYRTYYFTALILIAFSLVNLKPLYTELKSADLRISMKSAINGVAAVSKVAFATLACVVCIQTVYNYNFYALRTEMIRDQMEQIAITGDDEICVEAFALPCESFCMDSEYSSVLFDIIGSGRPKNMKTVDIMESSVSSVSQQAGAIMESGFFSNLKYAFSHPEYKNPYILSDV